MKRSVRYLLLAAVAGGVATPAVADNHVGNVMITAEVPAVCDIAASPLQVDATDGLVTGNVNEFCNTSRGFEVVAMHRPLTAGEAVEVDYGGQETALDQSGISPIAFRAGARLDSVPVAIHSTGLTQGLAVSFALTAI